MVEHKRQQLIDNHYLATKHAQRAGKTQRAK